MSREVSSSRGEALPWAAAAALCLALFWGTYRIVVEGSHLGLGGSLFLPTIGYFVVIALLLSFALPAAAFLAFALAEALRARLPAAWAALDGYDERRAIALGAIFALLVPMLARAWVFQGVAITDDEAAYRFSSELLASFKLWVASPPDKQFFDNAFLVNDGKLYSQYPLGWPLLLAPGNWLHAPWLMNPLYSAATMPALFLVARRFVSSAWAKVAMALFVLSPLAMFTAATYLSQTTSLFALAWTLWAALRSRDEDAPPWVDALVAGAFSLAFLIRPGSAAAMGLPMLISWAGGLKARPEGRRKKALAFALAAGAGATFFFVTNTLMNGSPLTTAYTRYLAYAAENQGHFVPWIVTKDTPTLFPQLEFRGLLGLLRLGAASLLRTSVDSFGWPIGYLFVPFAVRHARLIGWTLLAFIGSQFFYDAGVDTYGPNHSVEVVLPLVLLSVVGASALRDTLASTPWEWLPVTALLSLCGVAMGTHWPVRVAFVRDLVQDIAAPIEAIEAANLEDAVLFASHPFAPRCRANENARHFVFFRPNSPPSFDAPVLFVNHLTLEQDRAFLAAHYPARKGYLLGLTRKCEYRLVPLEEATETVFPPSHYLEPAPKR